MRQRIILKRGDECEREEEEQEVNLISSQRIRRIKGRLNDNPIKRKIGRKRDR
jgi:hypothetical protein